MHVTSATVSRILPLSLQLEAPSVFLSEGFLMRVSCVLKHVLWPICIGKVCSSSLLLLFCFLLLVASAPLGTGLDLICHFSLISAIQQHNLLRV